MSRLSRAVNAVAKLANQLRGADERRNQPQRGMDSSETHRARMRSSRRRVAEWLEDSPLDGVCNYQTDSSSSSRSSSECDDEDGFGDRDGKDDYDYDDPASRFDHHYFDNEGGRKPKDNFNEDNEIRAMRRRGHRRHDEDEDESEKEDESEGENEGNASPRIRRRRGRREVDRELQLQGSTSTNFNAHDDNLADEVEICSVTVKNSPTPTPTPEVRRTPSPRRTPNVTDSKRIDYLLAMAGIMAAIAGIVLIFQSLRYSDMDKFPPLKITRDLVSQKWEPFGCAPSETIATDKWGFRQCVVPGGKPKKSDRKHKIQILNDLLKMQQIDILEREFLIDPSDMKVCSSKACQRCTWHMRSSGIKDEAEKCKFARNYLFVTNGNSIFTIPFKEKVDVQKSVSEIDAFLLDEVDKRIMEEFNDHSKPWLDQFCPRLKRFNDGNKKDACEQSEYFRITDNKLKRNRHITFIEWNTIGGYLLWSDAGKPSAIVAGILEIDKTYDRLQFKKKYVHPILIFNNGEEPRGLAVFDKFIFYAAIYKPMTKSRFGKYWKGFVGAISLESKLSVKVAAAKQVLYTNRKIIEPLDVVIDPYRWKASEESITSRRIQVFLTDRRRAHIAVLHFDNIP